MGHIAQNYHYIFRKYSAPAHNSKRMQDWLKECLTKVCEKDIWPPSSPVCIGRLWLEGQYKASQQNREPVPKDQGGDGQEHYGESLKEFWVRIKD